MNEKKTIIITGGGRGIGAATALEFAKSGDRNLVLASRTAAEIAETAERCQALGAECLAIPTDVTDEAQVENLFRETRERFGAVDILVNNAGAGIFKPIVETTLDDWRKVIDVNATSAFLCSREALKIMIPQQSGVIVNVASVVGIAGYPNQAAYTASKHAMVGLTKVIAEEGKNAGIRAHVVCPGGVDTEMARQARPDLDPEILINPETVAETIAFLANLPKNASIDIVHLRRFGSKSFLL